MDFFAGLALQAGVGFNLPTGDGELTEFQEKGAIHLKLHEEELPLYLWSSYTEQENFILGQNTANIEALSFGLGKTFEVSPKFNVFFELGYSSNKADADPVVQQEIAYTYLVDRHNVVNRPIPVTVTRPYDQESYETTYEVDDSIIGKIGVSYDITESFSVGAAYRYNRIETKLELYDAESRAAGKGFWVENFTQDAGAVELQLLYSF